MTGGTVTFATSPAVMRCLIGSTGYTKAEIKEEFYRIVDTHIDAISMWAESEQRLERLAAFRMLKEEFEGTLKGLKVRCDGCHASYEVKVLKEGNSAGDLGSLHCLFCASRHISLARR